ncbi:hypothetical protein PAHAL_9G085700 [Panicum hallii]|uniref:Uncharacterized protein n=1 Tax=Panicum hallii TaxID=206008 RepID=A0A2T8I0M8_9POAL|nr:hypothetical protein PAHAL_9G085700 [Panicum hallii]
MQMLDDFVDTKDEMHMWNSLVRKQRSVSLVLTITEDRFFFTCYCYFLFI